MTATVSVLAAVAKELAKQAKDNMPKIREGEELHREWYSDGKYYRETSFDGERVISLFDFRCKE